MGRENNSQKVTLHDVARLCGVSYQTVSRVINDSPDVSVKTRRLVLKAIQSLGYHPNQLARSLKTRRSFILEVITFGVETYIPRELIITMGRAAIEHGYSLIFTDIPRDDPQEESRLLAHLNSGLIDGAIITAPVKSQLFNNLAADPPYLPILQIRNPRGSAAPSTNIMAASWQPGICSTWATAPSPRSAGRFITTRRSPVMPPSWKPCRQTVSPPHRSLKHRNGCPLRATWQPKSCWSAAQPSPDWSSPTTTWP
jgi:transcriptional regulator with XRE-family HTH domain